MTETTRYLTLWLAVAVGAAALLTGCATNSLLVTETTPDGGTFSVRQETRSTWGSKTDEGTGSVTYTGIAPDGSEFDFAAGNAVRGQQANEPVASVTELIRLLAGLAAGAKQETTNDTD